jgi:hypothetical protein
MSTELGTDLAEDPRLSEERPFLPESLAGTESLDFLTPSERLALNRIRGRAYLVVFGLTESDRRGPGRGIRASRRVLARRASDHPTLSVIWTRG